MKKILLAAFLFIASSGFTGCSHDHDIYDDIAGRVWAGDLGFYDGPYAIDSFVRFGRDGFGEDMQYYNDNGDPAAKFNIRWTYDNNNRIFINYGYVAPERELRRVYIRRSGIMEADLYIEGWFYGPITLYMQ